MIQLAGTAASIVESISFSRLPSTCEHGGHHDRYGIHWKGNGPKRSHYTYWCDHPLCDVEPWYVLGAPPRVKSEVWIPKFVNAVATGYFLLIRSRDELPRMEARIGIVGQWDDPERGNYVLPPGEGRKRFTERYWGESGPGIYPAQIHTLSNGGIR